MIKEDYVSYEVAHLLKEKGFDEECTYYYTPDGKLGGDCGVKFLNSEFSGCISTPTHQMACKWLREEKNIIIFIMPCKDDLGNFTYFYDIATWDENEGVYEMNHASKWFHIYEEAVEEALKYTLENLI